ncbi:serine hydrolase domain-containing protein [Cellulomonas timonensis]|uniref:serine hydrolase domain-containing protein n=1 Tax=Cellulomonas timonensis TaxID=1689271 RepID=UPI000A5BE2C0|nr:serine hydrolase domain-containing protein [Cellulomonas timonensis]
MPDTPLTSATMPATASIQAIHDLLSAAAMDDGFSGAVHIAQGAEPLLDAGYGVTSRRWHAPVTTATRFDIASITKLFTAVAVLQQVEAGRLDLDAPITDVVDLSGTTIAPAVTLRHLLTHTSGIGDDADEEAGESYEALWLERPCHTVTTTADFLPQFAHKPANFAPGEGCRYCNVGYVLAGLALEAVTGTPYRDHVREHVLARAGMHSSGFFDMRDAVPDVAEGWDPVRDDDGAITGWRSNIFCYPPIGSPDGGAHATARDLVRFLDAVRGGELLGPEMTAAFLTPQVTHHESEGHTVRYGFGLEFVVLPDGSVRSSSKDGINAGASAILRHYPASDVTVALVTSSEDGAWAPFRQIDEILDGR